MNKFKKILLGALSVLTLGLVAVTGAKVNATDVTDIYNFTIDDFSGVAVGADKDVTATESNSEKTLTVKFENTASKQATAINSSKLRIYYKDSSDSVNFSFANTLGSITIEMEFTSQSDSKGWTGSLDNGTSKNLKGKNLTQTFTSNSVGNHVLTLTNDDLAKDFYINSFTIKETYDTASPKDQAIAAINAIPSEITYTAECKNLIDTAATKISAVADEDKDDITNLATYNAAVTSFNNLESTKISAFTSAVTSIGTVTASSGSAIEAAQAAYEALLASTKEKSNVVSAKADLDTAIAAYELVVYNAASKSYVVPADTVYEKDKDNKSVAVTYTEKTQLGNSIFYATNGMAYKDEAVLTIGEASWNDRLYTGGNSTCSSKKQERVVTFETKTSGTLKLAASSQNNTTPERTVDLYNSSFAKTSQSAQIADSNNTYMYFDIPAAGTYYLGSTGGVNFFYLEFIPETSYTANDVTLTFETQYDEEEAADSTKLRFVGTIKGVAYADYANIETIKFAFTFKGTERTVSVNNLYKSIVSGTKTIKAAADNTMYVIYQLNKINKAAYQGQKLTDCKFIITFTDGSTVSVNRDDITLPTTFTSVVA